MADVVLHHYAVLRHSEAGGWQYCYGTDDEGDALAFLEYKWHRSGRGYRRPLVVVKVEVVKVRVGES